MLPRRNFIPLHTNAPTSIQDVGGHNRAQNLLAAADAPIQPINRTMPANFYNIIPYSLGYLMGVAQEDGSMRLMYVSAAQPLMGATYYSVMPPHLPAISTNTNSPIPNGIVSSRIGEFHQYIGDQSAQNLQASLPPIALSSTTPFSTFTPTTTPEASSTTAILQTDPEKLFNSISDSAKGFSQEVNQINGKRKRKQHTSTAECCGMCGTNKSPEWRNINNKAQPSNSSSVSSSQNAAKLRVCNACGLHYEKCIRKEKKASSSWSATRTAKINDILNSNSSEENEAISQITSKKRKSKNEIIWIKPGQHSKDISPSSAGIAPTFFAKKEEGKSKHTEVQKYLNKSVPTEERRRLKL